MNNRNPIFKSYLMSRLLVAMNVKVTQGPYVVSDLIRRFSKREYTKKEFLKTHALVVWNYAKYGFHVDEFFYYDVDCLSDKGKKKYINEETRWGYYAKLNRESDIPLFDNKEQTYELFKKYFNRELVYIKSGRMLKSMRAS